MTIKIKKKTDYLEAKIIKYHTSLHRNWNKIAPNV